MSDRPQTPYKLEELLSFPLERLACAVGRESNLWWLYDDEGQGRRLLPILTGPYTPPGPYPEAFYRAQKWLRLKRTEIQKTIIEVFDYGSKKDLYPRGKESDLVLDLADALAPLCHEPSPVDPTLVAALIFRLGLAEFCRDFDQGPRFKPWSLEEALGFDAQAANEAASRGGALFYSGDWKAAIPFYQKALSHYPVHVAAMNDLAYIYATYLPGEKKGLEYAEFLLMNTSKGEARECEILDTAGWSYYRHAGDLVKSEEYLRDALKLRKPGEPYYISLAYHLMSVLKDANKIADLNVIYDTLSGVHATNQFDREAHVLAKKLVKGVPRRPHPR